MLTIACMDMSPLIITELQDRLYCLVGLSIPVITSWVFVTIWFRKSFGLFSSADCAGIVRTPSGAIGVYDYISKLDLIF